MHTPIILFIILSFIPGNSLSQNLSDYLVLEDIGSYKKITKGGRRGNILVGAGHFGLDHKDKSYGIVYVHDETQMWIDVKVTQHEGSDSVKWLVHEVESSFRGRTKEGWLGQSLYESASIREIDGT